MRIYIIGTIHILSVIFFAGCGNQSAENKTEKPTQEINTSTEQDFSKFWTAFRNAVLENNMAEIKKRTSFPLLTRGEMDNSAVIPVSEKEFDSVFSVFLETPTGLNANDFNETERQYIKANPTITFNENKLPMMSDSTASITSMEFKKYNNGWKMVSLYLDEDTYIKCKDLMSTDKPTL